MSIIWLPPTHINLWMRFIFVFLKKIIYKSKYLCTFVCIFHHGTPYLSIGAHSKQLLHEKWNGVYMTTLDFWSIHLISMKLGQIIIIGRRKLKRRQRDYPWLSPVNLDEHDSDELLNYLSDFHGILPFIKCFIDESLCSGVQRCGGCGDLSSSFTSHMHSQSNEMICMNTSVLAKE